MEPDNGGGLGSTGVAVAMTLIVAIVVLIMVNIGGGLFQPLTTPHVAMTPPVQSQG